MVSTPAASPAGSRLHPIDDDLWEAPPHVLHMPGGVKLPARMTIVRLPDKILLLHSPVPIDDDLAAELERLGPVAHLVAPNCLHHLFLRSAVERWPAARLWGAPGLAAKRPELRFHDTLGDDAPPAWRDALEQVFIAGAPRLNEVVFFHRASQTLICSDLLFNLTHYDGAMTGLVLWLMGTRKQLAQSRFWRMYTRDRTAARAAGRRILAWDIRRVVPGHGEIASGNLRPTLAATMRRMAGGPLELPP